MRGYIAAEKEVNARSFDSMKNRVSGMSLLQTEKGRQYFDQAKLEGLRESDFIEYCLVA